MSWPAYKKDGSSFSVVETTSPLDWLLNRHITRLFSGRYKMPMQASVDEHLSAEITPVAGARLPANGRQRRPISIVWLTTCLEVGGAEMMLTEMQDGELLKLVALDLHTASEE